MKRYFLKLLILLFIFVASFGRTYSPGVAIRVITSPQSTEAEIQEAIKDAPSQWKENNGDVIKKALQRARHITHQNQPKQHPQKSTKPSQQKPKVQLEYKEIEAVVPKKEFIEYYEAPLEVQGKPQVQMRTPSSESSTPAKPVAPSPELYNTQFLKRKKEVREFLLTKEGFSEAVIKTSPKAFSSMLYKIVPEAQYSFVCFGGWGSAKEFLAPLYAILKDQPCSIFLCETRTVHQSLLQNAWEFGQYSEQDVIECLAKAHDLSPAVPLVVWGTCAGAFYATRALVELNQEKKLSAYKIAALIFDSGWGAVDEAIVTSWKGSIKEQFARFIAPHAGFKDYREAEKTWAVKMLSGISNWFINVFSWYTIKPLYMYRTYKTDLNKTIGQLKIPIFFIHSLDDWKKPMSMAKELYEKAHNKTAWWIEFPSTHSMHHFKHKDEYKKRCLDFIENKVLRPRRS